MSEQLCECGCGNPAPIAKKTNKAYGWVKGEPKRFIHTHYAKNHRLEEHPSWKGGVTRMSDGYIQRMDESGSYKRVHILIAERVLGRPLPPQAEVHHVNQDKGDNRNENLVICESRAFHQLLHQRMRAYQATGSPLSVKCIHCKPWGMPGDEMNTVRRSDGSRGHSYHHLCHATARREVRSELAGS